jgi:hypothetical protein
VFFCLALISGLQAQDASSGASEDPFESSFSEEFSNVDRSGGVGSAAASSVGRSEAGGAAGASGGGFGAFGGGGFGGLGSLFNSFNNGGGQAVQPSIRTRLRSAIEITPRSPLMVQQAATERFAQLAGKPSLRGIRVRMEGRTAVLTGSVANERDRRMSQLLVQLEPGVRQVENRIVVTK